MGQRVGGALRSRLEAGLCGLRMWNVGSSSVLLDRLVGSVPESANFRNRIQMLSGLHSSAERASMVYPSCGSLLE